MKNYKEISLYSLLIVILITLTIIANSIEVNKIKYTANDIAKIKDGIRAADSLKSITKYEPQRAIIQTRKNNNEKKETGINKITNYNITNNKNYQLNIGKNESKWIDIPNGAKYNFNKEARIIVTDENGIEYKSWEPGSWPQKVNRIKVTNLGNNPVELILR